MVYLKVNDVEWSYRLDKAKHDRFFKFFKHKPLTALNYIKGECYWSKKEE